MTDTGKARLNLVADIGGTNTRMALARGRQVLPDSIRSFQNREYAALGQIIGRFLSETGAKVTGACFAAAGIVEDGRVDMTNLDWAIDHASLREQIGCATVEIINDLQAQGHALGHLAQTSVDVLVPAQDAPADTRLVVGIGTGFNAAVVFETAAGRLVPPSETGHTDLLVRTEAEFAFMTYLLGEKARAETEDALSGQGLENIYHWVSGQHAAASDIMDAVASGRDPKALQAFDHFTGLLARTLGALSLVHLPVGGVFLAGGVARAIAPHLNRFEFRNRYRDGGRFAPLMERFAVHVITDDNAALTGCAAMLESRDFTAS